MEQYTFPDSKCPICGSHYEDTGTEEIRDKWKLITCYNCGYVFDVE